MNDNLQNYKITKNKYKEKDILYIILYKLF